MSSLDAARRKYNFPDLFIASWRDPALSVHPARGGPGSPGFATYKVNYDLLPQQTDAEISANISDAADSGSNEEPAIDHDTIDLPFEEISPQDENLDWPDSQDEAAHSETSIAEVQQANAELGHDNMGAEDDLVSSPVEPGNADTSSGPDALGELGVDDWNVLPDDASDDRRVSFAPGTPDPKPTPRKKKGAKATKGKKKRIAVPLDSLPADVIAMVDEGFGGHPPPAPHPPTQEVTLEGEGEQNGEATPEETLHDDVHSNETTAEDSAVTPSTEDAPNEGGAVFEAVDDSSYVAPAEDEPQAMLDGPKQEPDQPVVPPDALAGEPSIESIGVEGQKEGTCSSQDAVGDGIEDEPTQTSPSPDPGVDIPLMLEKPPKKKSSKSSKDKEKSRKKSSKAEKKQPSSQPAGLGIDMQNSEKSSQENPAEGQLPLVTETEDDVGSTPAEDEAPAPLPDENSKEAEALLVTAEEVKISDPLDPNANVDESTTRPPGDISEAPVEAGNITAESAEHDGTKEVPAATDQTQLAASDEVQENDSAPTAQEIPKEVVNEALEENVVLGDSAAIADSSELKSNADGDIDAAKNSETEADNTEQTEKGGEPGPSPVEDLVTTDESKKTADSLEGLEGGGLEEHGVIAEASIEIPEAVENETAPPVVDEVTPEKGTDVVEAGAIDAGFIEPDAIDGHEESQDDNDAEINTCEGDAGKIEVINEPQIVAEAEHGSTEVVIETTSVEHEAGDAEIEMVEAPVTEEPIQERPPSEMEVITEPPASPTKSKRDSHESHKRKTDSWKRKHTTKPLKEIFEDSTVLQRPHDPSQRGKDAIRVKNRESQRRRPSITDEDKEERRRHRDVRKAEEGSRRAEEERKRAESEERRRSRRAIRRAAEEEAARLEKDAAAMEAEARRLRRKQREAQRDEARPQRENKVSLPSFTLPSILNLASGESVHRNMPVRSHGGAYRPTSSSGSSKEESRSTEVTREKKTTSPPASRGERSHQRYRQRHRETEENRDGVSRRSRDGEYRPKQRSVDQNVQERPRSFFGSLMKKS